MGERERDRLYAALVVAFAAAMLALRVVAEPIDHGYVRYAGIADAIVRSGDWIVLRLGDDLYVNKPPLFVWIIALARTLSGSAAGWTQHAPNLLALALLGLFTARLARRIFGRTDAAIAATLLLLTSFEVLILARDKRIDPLFGACLLAATDAFHLAWTAAEGPAGRGARLRGWIAAGAWLAGATLTKGPLALAFFATSALGLAVWERRLRDLARPEVILGGVVCLALSAIWPVWLVQRLGLDETRAALRAVDLTTREAGPLHYLLNLPLQLLPWTIFAPALALHLRGTLSGPSRGAVRFLVAGFLGVFVLLHLSETKHSRYLLPAFPPLCLLLVTLWFDPSTGEATRLPPRVARWRDAALEAALWLFLVASVAGFAALPFVPQGRAPIAIAAGLGAVGAARGLRRLRWGGDPGAALLRLGLLALLGIAAYDGARAERLASADDTAAARAALAGAAGEEPALLVGLDEGPSLVIPMLTGRTHPHVASAEAAVARVLGAAAAPVWMVGAPPDAEVLGKDPRLAVDSRATFELGRADLVLLAVRPAARPGPVVPGGPSFPSR